MVKEINSTYESAVQESAELERVKKELEKSLETIAAFEASYLELLENDADALIILDQQGIISLANAAAGEIFGCEADDLSGKPFGFPLVAGKTTKISIDRADGKTTKAEMRVLEINRSGDSAYLALMRNMAGQRQMMKSLRESEQKYKTLTEHLNVGVYRNTPGNRGKFIEINPASISMFGYGSKEEFLAVDVASLYQNPEDRKRFSQKLLSKGFVRDEELQLKKKDGSEFTASVSAVAVKDKNGEVIYFDGIIEDITERKQAAENLRESEERYRALVENSNEVILVAQDGILKFINARAMEVTGYSKDELTSNPFTDFVHPDDRDMVIERHIERLKGSNVPNTYTLRIVDKDGSIKWMEINSALITWYGRPATLSFLTDITERKRTEEALREIENQLQVQYKGIPVPSYKWKWTGGDFELIDYNDAAVVITEGRITNLLGLKAGELYQDKPNILKKMHQCFNEKTSIEQEMLYDYKSIDQTKYLLVRYTFVLPDLVLVHTEDITKRKQAEQALQQSEEREALAYDQGRLEIVDTILHNIGNAINSVTIGIGTIQEYLMKNRARQHFAALANAVKEHKDNFSSYVGNNPQGQKVADFIVALSDEYEKYDEEMGKTVKRVRDSANRIAEITRTTKSLSRRSAYHKEINLEKAINNAFTVLQDTIGKRGIEFVSDCINAPEEINTQESQFNQMLINLIKNSVEAIDDLKAMEGLSDSPYIKVRSYVQANSIIIDVTDNGVGIERDKLEAIFRSDYTTKKDGTGLGLHSIANFVKGSGGQIQALSDGIGKGATMRITLPMSSENS